MLNITILKQIFPILLKGAGLTIELTFGSIIIGCILGVIVAMVELSPIKIISAIGHFYTWILRGTPLLLQLFVFYFGLPAIGIRLSSFQASLLAISLNSGAYMGEIIRGGIQAIDKGQFEASKALGFTYFQTMKRIILPQTVKIIIPSVGNEFITLLKDTSLVSAIALEEIMRKAYLYISATGNPIAPYFAAACLYLLMTTGFTALFSIVEKKLSVY